MNPIKQQTVTLLSIFNAIMCVYMHAYILVLYIYYSIYTYIL